MTGARARAAAGLVFLVAAGLFLWRAAPGVTFEDSGELAAAAATGGVPHPPGYPFLMVVGRAWIALTSFLTGDAARSLNLLSALSAAGAAGLLALTLARLGAGAGSTFATGLLAILATTFAAQAVITEVYAPAALLLAALVCVALTARRPAVPSALLLGLACTAHQAAALFLPLVLYALARELRRPEPGRGGLGLVLRTLGAGALGLALYAYVPLAALRDPPVSWGEATSFAALRDHVLRAQYRTGLEHDFPAELGFLYEQSVGQWPLAALVALLGLVLVDAVRREGEPQHGGAARAAVAIVVLTALVTAAGLVLAIGFPVAEEETRARLAGATTPLLLLVVVLSGLGLAGWEAWLAERIPRAAAVVPVAAVLALAPVLGPRTLAGAADQRHASWAEDYALEVLAACPRDAVLLIGKRGYSDVLYFPLLYEQVVHGVRPDVLLLERESLEMRWRRRQLARREPSLAGALARLEATWEAADVEELGPAERRMLSVPFLHQVFDGPRPVVSIHAPGERVLEGRELVPGPVLWRIAPTLLASPVRPVPSSAPPAVLWLPAEDRDPWTAVIRDLTRERDLARADALEALGETAAARPLRERWTE